MSSSPSAASLSSDGPLVSVVIPTLDAGPSFRDTLAAVRAQQGVGDVELLVIDSQSSDDTVRWAREAGARTRVILRSTFNHGTTRNHGAALTRGRAIAFLTQDALPANDRWLAGLWNALAAEPNAAGAYSRVVPRPGCSPLVERSVRADLVFSERREVKRGDPERIARMTPFERRVFFHFNNVASMVRRSVFERIPFPETPFGEDLAWGGRVLEEGHDLVYEPASVVVHSHASHLREDFRRHRSDAVLMRTLFGFRNREGLRDCLPAWWQELRRDREFLKQRGVGLLRGLRWLAEAALLRGVQIAGQLAGSRAASVGPPRFSAELPRTEDPRSHLPA